MSENQSTILTPASPFAREFPVTGSGWELAIVCAGYPWIIVVGWRRCFEEGIVVRGARCVRRYDAGDPGLAGLATNAAIATHLEDSGTYRFPWSAVQQVIMVPPEGYDIWTPIVGPAPEEIPDRFGFYYNGFGIVCSSYSWVIVAGHIVFTLNGIQVNKGRCIRRYVSGDRGLAGVAVDPSLVPHLETLADYRFPWCQVHASIDCPPEVWEKKDGWAQRILDARASLGG